MASRIKNIITASVFNKQILTRSCYSMINSNKNLYLVKLIIQAWHFLLTYCFTSKRCLHHTAFVTPFPPVRVSVNGYTILLAIFSEK